MLAEVTALFGEALKVTVSFGLAVEITIGRSQIAGCCQRDLPRPALSVECDGRGPLICSVC